MECTDFLESVRSGRRPRSDGEAGARVTRVLAAAARSLAAGGSRVEIEGLLPSK
jgi:predicted dehydrogenase